MARGLAARNVGDLFVDSNGVKWELSSLLHFPEDQRNESYESLTDLNTKIASFKEKNNIDDLSIINDPNEGTKAAIYFSLRNKNNEEKNYLRYFKKLQKSGLPFSWGGKQLKESTGFSVHGTGSQSEHIPIKPSEIISTDQYIDTDEVISLIDQKMELPTDFRVGTVKMLTALQNNQMPFVKGLGKYRSAVEKYVGEYAGPIYTINNQEKLSTEIDNIKKDVDYTKVFFPVSGNWPLVDSFIADSSTTNKLGISSKGGSTGGAAASIQTVSDIYEYEIDVNHPIRKEATDVIDALKLISKHSMIEGPLKAANRLGLLSDDDQQYVIHQINMHRQSPDGLIPKSIAKMMENIKPKLAHGSYSIGLHMLSGVARGVCYRLNDDPRMDRVFRTALKEKNFVQVYAYTEKSGDSLRFSRFSLVDPANFSGTIAISANKPYMASTKPKGKITFEIKQKR